MPRYIPYFTLSKNSYCDFLVSKLFAHTSFPAMAASSLALKRFLSSSGLIFSRSLRPARAVAQPSRFFNTNAAPDYEYDNDDSDFEVDRRPVRCFFSPYYGVYDPFSARTNPSLMPNMMDSPVVGPGMRRNWDAKETADGLHLRVDMPGLGKEDVKVLVEQNTLVIKGEEKKEFEDDEAGCRYTSRIGLPEKIYKTDGIKAEMKNGVLKVYLPRIKEEERTDVFQVKVE